MRVILIALFAVCATAGAASAQYTYCEGDKCTLEENGVKRDLSAEEVGKMKRANSRTSVSNIECKFSERPAQCEHLQKTLFGLFPF
jgi:hypothetical protein